ncbi:hypothetical protein RA224_09500 [Achromobacter aegrifaciens]|uniref:hypothetical protein n=1 Tax=Achromobacter aegrifaciens TaxID=1287736 RepID=UPI0027B9DCFF|nr:hypothetical protein [Achromobacter aegrifaciens]WLW63637.1 hypothetical protein RA224_09500 [Achromobacter aegrifaciens]
MRSLVMIMAALALVGCSKDPVSVSGTDNREIQVDELFTHRGVTIYRFSDGNRRVYFSSIAGDVTAKHTENCGKDCFRTVTVESKGAGQFNQAGGR